MGPLFALAVAAALGALLGSAPCHASRYTSFAHTAGPLNGLRDGLGGLGDGEDGVDPGAPLFLTPLIEAGKVAEAQQAAAVKPLVGSVQSYAGFLTVNKVGVSRVSSDGRWFREPA